MRKLFFLLALSSLASALDLGSHISSKQFDNGLKVFVVEDHRAPLSWFQIWYNVGSSDENTGLTGISHALEHMMFKGTKNNPTGKIVEIVDENGGSQNAFTSRDYTCYWQMFPSDKLELSFQLESDRMQNLVLSEKDFISEKKVILEERKMRVDDNPNGLANEQYMASLALATPYQNPVIGWQRDIINISIEDMRDWYNTWYTPNNATIVVAGDVDPENVFAMTEKYFKDIPSSKLPVANNMNPVPQLGKKSLVVKGNVKVPSVSLGFIAPSLISVSNEDKDDVYALAVLSEVLSGGQSSLLDKELVRSQEVATSAGCSYLPFAKYDVAFSFYGVPTKGHTVMDVEDAIYRLLNRLQTTLLSADDLKKVKARIVTSEIYGKESPENQATNLGAIASIGLTWRDYQKFIDKVQQVTPEQVRTVINKYFKHEKLVSVYLESQKKGS